MVEMSTAQIFLGEVKLLAVGNVILSGIETGNRGKFTNSISYPVIAIRITDLRKINNHKTKKHSTATVNTENQLAL